MARPGSVTPRALSVIRGIVHPIMRVVSRPSLEGIDRLPRGKANESVPFLLVGNHPSSLATFEFLSFMALYARAFPADAAPPPLAAFALAMAFRWWPVSAIAPAIGAIPSTYAAAEDALAKGVPLVLFPGGDHEAFRPFWKQDHADFGGRKGFLRISHEAWVPVVPFAIRGVSAPMLHSSRALAYLAVWPRLFGLKRYAIGVLGVVGAALIVWLVPLALPWRALLAWAWLASPLSIMSWFPTTVRIRVGEPIAPESLFGDREAVSEETLERALHIVESAVTRLLARR